METTGNSWNLSRRHLLGLAAAGLLPWRELQASEFWDKKDPSVWSSEEIERLITKSPWAKEVSAQMVMTEGGGRSNPNGGGYPGGGGGGMPRIGIGGIGFPRGGGRGMGRGGPGGGGTRTTNFKGTVRWESAEPIRLAMKETLDPEFDKHYVIRVSDFPLLAMRNQSDESDDGPQDQDQQRKKPGAAFDELKQNTTLQVKNKPLAQAGIVKRPTSSNSIVLFGFAKDLFDFGKDDHEVEFYTRTGDTGARRGGRLIVKAVFNLKEMVYRGKLAV